MYPRYRAVRPLVIGKKQPKNITDRTTRNECKAEPQDDLQCSSSESVDLEDVYQERPDFQEHAFPDDYWKFKKAIKYLSYGRPVITALSLLAVYECDFQDPIMLKALADRRLLEILLNFLHSKDKRLQTISLRFLRKLSKIRSLRHEMVYLGGLQSMVSLLREPQIDLKEECAKTIAAVSDFHRAWTAVRKAGGITLLVKMIYVPKILLNSNPSTLSGQLMEVLLAAEAAAEALLVICQCSKNKIEFLLSGALRGCQNILKTSHTRLCTLVLNIINRCAFQRPIQLAIRNLSMLEDFRVHFYAKDPGLVQAAALAAFHCAQASESVKFYGKEGFVDKLFEIIQTSAFHSDPELMASISGALWKCAENRENVARLQALNCGPLLVQLLGPQPAKVQEYLVACLSCCLFNSSIRNAVRKNNGIESLIYLLVTTHPPLIMHLNKALAEASIDPECLSIMDKQNALRLIWSHLRNDDPSVVANTAWQLTAILKNIENSSVHVRTLVGGVQVLIDCLHSGHTRVATSVCALIVVLCKDPHNRMILTDYQVVKNLSILTGTRCRRLRYHLCMAITACCLLRANREEFARRQIAYPLMLMLKSKSPVVQGAAARALHQLAYIPQWCAVMYNCEGVFATLLKLLKNRDKEVQESAADVIQKMRIFALNRDGNVPRWMMEKHSTFFPQ